MTSILIISSTIAIGVTFLCSVAEALLLSMNPLTLNQLQATRLRTAQSWRNLKKNMARPITAILVLNTIAHTGGATVAGGAFAQIYGENNGGHPGKRAHPLSPEPPRRYRGCPLG